MATQARVQKINRSPLSFYNEADNIKAGYIKKDDFQLYINPDNIWIGKDNKYPNGVMIGKVKYNMENNSEDIHAEKSSSFEVFPLILWFDETYEGN